MSSRTQLLAGPVAFEAGETPPATATCSRINLANTRRPNGRGSPISLYRKYKADRVVAEVNSGGDMVEATIGMVDPNISYAAVRASRGKVALAKRVAALYEQNKIHHVGSLATLEDQICGFTSDFDLA